MHKNHNFAHTYSKSETGDQPYQTNVAPGPERTGTVLHAEMLPQQSEKKNTESIITMATASKYLPRMLEEFQAKVEDINDSQRQV